MPAAICPPHGWEGPLLGHNSLARLGLGLVTCQTGDPSDQGLFRPVSSNRLYKPVTAGTNLTVVEKNSWHE